MPAYTPQQLARFANGEKQRVGDKALRAIDELIDRLQCTRQDVENWMNSKPAHRPESYGNAFIKVIDAVAEFRTTAELSARIDHLGGE
jgi:hypothetical protein